MAELEANVRGSGIDFSDPDSGNQGIVHVIGPEQGLTQPGMTIVCGDSHTSTHGAFGALAFGIGTSQIRDVLATGCIAMEKQQVRKIEVTGELGEGVTAKDVILTIIGKLGTDGGVGYVYEYAGEAIEDLGMEGRMSICNMSIEGGAPRGIRQPRRDHLRVARGDGRLRRRPREVRAAETLLGVDPERRRRRVRRRGHHRRLGDRTDRHVGTTPGQTAGITEPIPDPDDLPEEDRDTAKRAQKHMRVEPGDTMEGYDIDVAFLGSCTNARLKDLREAAAFVEGREVDDDVRAMVVPGSQRVRDAAEAEGIDEIFIEAGFDWREPGCSMCLGMNDDQLVGDEASASSSNRNFVGRQGSKDGRTVLMSPIMVAAAAVTGEVTDVREMEEVATV